MAIDWETVTFGAPNPFTWDAGWSSWPTWMLTALPEPAALPTVVPESVATAEVCFRLPDGWSICTVPGIWAQDYRNRGYEEIPSSAPEFIPPTPPTVIGSQSPVFIPTDASQEIPGDAQVSFHEPWIDWGTTVIQDWLSPATTPLWGTPSIPQNIPVIPPAYGGPVTQSGCGSCGTPRCVCGTINGRPALVDAVTGKRCYRRRRRRLLTEGDFNDLMRIATLPNKQNVSVALAKAIGRR